MQQAIDLVMKHLRQHGVDGLVGPITVEHPKGRPIDVGNTPHIVVPVKNEWDEKSKAIIADTEYANMNIEPKIAVAAVLEAYCTNDDLTATFIDDDGREWLIGDGDDSGAVWWDNGAFHIWLRTWDRED